MTNFWLNIDLPTKKCHLHKSSCNWAKGKYSTTPKGIGKLHQDGGWLESKSELASEEYYEENYGSRRGYVFAKCKECF